MSKITQSAKPVACKVCRSKFHRARPMQRVCSPDCALAEIKAATEKNQKKATREERAKDKTKREAMQGLPELKAKAQTAFNAYIRARDMGKPCISCGKPLTTEPNTYDCGHYRSVGSAPHMRYVEDNAHGQCKHCNRHLAGNHVAYRLGLVDRIGAAAVELIERDQTIRKYTKDGLREIESHYRSEARKLTKGEK
jgi:hypothetical protein